MFRPYEFEAMYSSFPFPAVVQDEFSSIDQLSTCITSPNTKKNLASRTLLHQPQDEYGTEPVQLFAGQFETKTLDILEGRVKYVGEEVFVVQFVDVDHELQPPKFLGEFDKSDLTNDDLEVLEVDSIIICEIKVNVLPNGEEKEDFDVKLIRLPEITEEDWERARVETQELLERLGITDA